MDTTADAVARELIEAFNAADWGRFRAALAEGIVYEETGTGRRVEGIEPYVALCQGWRQALPDAAGSVRRAVAAGDTAALEVAWTGTHQGELEGPGGPIPASGRPVEVEATLWVTAQADQAAAVRHHLDVLALLAQVGALPGA
jgi:steroid delta-isomerase-like uncharacterized protein